MVKSAHGRMVRLAATIIATCIFHFCIAATVSAHAVLLSSIPATGEKLSKPPSKFVLNFSEPVTPVVVSLVDIEGNSHPVDVPVGQGQGIGIGVPQPLSEGRYSFSWRVISDDGHPVAGAVVFAVGDAAPGELVSMNPDAPWNCQVLTLVAKLFLYVGSFLGVGGLFFYKAVGRSDDRRMWILIFIFIASVSGVTALCLLGLEERGATSIMEIDAAAFMLACTSTFGRSVSILESALLLSLAAQFSRGRLSAYLATASFILLAAAFASSGHAASAEPRWLSSTAVAIHVLGVSFWLGALVPLSGLLKSGDASHAALRRFSRAIAFAIAMMLFSGAYLSWLQLGSFEALWTTEYGTIYAGKMALVLTALALGLLNRYVFTPRIISGDERATVRMRVSVFAEMGLMALVLAAVSLWRFTPPPRALDLAAPVQTQAHVHTVEAMADLEFNTTADLRMTANISLSDGEFAQLGAREVTVTFAASDGLVAPFKVRTTRFSENMWRIDQTPMPCNCDWKITVEALVSDFKMLGLEGDVKLRP
jgi:copper transport protein